MNDLIFLPWITSSERRLGPPIFFIEQTQDRKRKLVQGKQISKSPKSKNSYMLKMDAREKAKRKREREQGGARESNYCKKKCMV
jgi:hypothetical protein